MMHPPLFMLRPDILIVLQALSTYEIPIWHPIVVHYPIALVAAGMLAALGWLVVGTRFWRHCTVYLYGLGLAATGAAYWTGEEAYEQSKDVPIVDELAPVHADYAAYTLAAVAVVTVVLAAAVVWINRRPLRVGDAAVDPFWIRAVVVLLSAAATTLIVYTAHLGGLMVWGV